MLIAGFRAIAVYVPRYAISGGSQPGQRAAPGPATPGTPDAAKPSSARGGGRCSLKTNQRWHGSGGSQLGQRTPSKPNKPDPSDGKLDSDGEGERPTFAERLSDGRPKEKVK